MTFQHLQTSSNILERQNDTTSPKPGACHKYAVPATRLAVNSSAKALRIFMQPSLDVAATMDWEWFQKNHGDAEGMVSMVYPWLYTTWPVLASILLQYLSGHVAPLKLAKSTDAELHGKKPSPSTFLFAPAFGSKFLM